MYKPIQSQFFIIAFLLYLLSGTASAEDYSISADFVQYPGSATHIVLINQYCMDSADDNVKLDNTGHAIIDVDTDGGIFNKCGWVHSDATYQALNDKNKVKVEFEFYKPLAQIPKLELITLGVESGCTVSGPNPLDPKLHISCGRIR